MVQKMVVYGHLSFGSRTKKFVVLIGTGWHR